MILYSSKSLKASRIKRLAMEILWNLISELSLLGVLFLSYYFYQKRKVTKQEKNETDKQDHDTQI